MRFRSFAATVAVIAAATLSIAPWSSAKSCVGQNGNIPNGTTRVVKAGIYVDGDVVIDDVTVVGKRILMDRTAKVYAPNGGASWVKKGCNGKRNAPIVRYPGDPIFSSPSVPTTTTPTFTPIPIPTTTPCGPGTNIPANVQFTVGAGMVLDGDFEYQYDGKTIGPDNNSGTAMRTYTSRPVLVIAKYPGWMTTKGCEPPLNKTTQVVFI